MPVWEPRLKGASCVKKIAKPILTKDDIPYEAELVFNAGVAKVNGKYIMAFRNDCGATREQYEKKERKLSKTSVGIAISDNGIDGWQVKETPLISYSVINKVGYNLLEADCGLPDIRRLYDPRITVIEDEIYLCLAADTTHGIRGCIAKLDKDLEHYEIVSASVPDNRNMVLFPQKIGGYYVRLERPFPVYGRSGKDRFDIWLSKSPDLKFWGESQLLLGVEHVPFANDKIGPAAPPVKTPHGWLTLFHAVDKETEGRGQTEWEGWWNKRYTAGIMLLDLENPSKVIGMCKTPLIVPELPHEADHGFRQNVIFPGGMILEESGEVKIYYGAADTVECVATAHVDDLIALCTEQL
ncbi:MAG: glycoside hydrolase family 130 protein [Clostridia bacterium]|nr:glycoside hydrolase family 130 protein [Clostridia bacterium]